jgi:peptidoglycan-associated lipoprotein
LTVIRALTGEINMSYKKFATAVIVSGVAFGLVGCTASKNRNASNEYTDSNGVNTASNFYGEVLSPEQELALLNQKVVHFAYDDSRLTHQDERVLNVHAKYMLDHPNISMRIKGHTDERGGREYNIALGERRAQAVARFLETRGVPSNRLSEVSYGKEQPVNLESNEAAWAENRRAELEYGEIG